MRDRCREGKVGVETRRRVKTETNKQTKNKESEELLKRKRYKKKVGKKEKINEKTEEETRFKKTEKLRKVGLHQFIWKDKTTSLFEITKKLRFY